MGLCFWTAKQAVVLLRNAAEKAKQNKMVSSHGPWKMEARSDKMLLKANKLPETAKSLGHA